MQRPRIRSLKLPTTLFVIVLVVTVALTVLWNLILVFYNLDLQEPSPIPRSSGFYWTFIVVGTALFAVVIVFSSLLGAQLIGEIRQSRRQTNFIASVSHELNSPLSAIKLFAQTLQTEGLSPEERSRFQNRILEDVERLKHLIANILRAAELDVRKKGLRTEGLPVDLYTAAEAYLSKTSEWHEERGESISLRLDGSPGVSVKLDSALFEHVLENLVDNAIRYRCEEPVRIEVEVRAAGDWAELRVRDNGIGMPARELRRVFDRFYRIEDDDPKRRRKGTGIGLFIVRTIVEAHKGRVEAVSAGPGTGTTIVIRLPRLQKIDASGANPTGAPPRRLT